MVRSSQHMVSCFDACLGNGSDSHVGYAYFAPTIIKTYGYGSTFCSAYLGPLFFAENLTLFLEFETQLFSIPPWAAAFVFSMCIAFLSDKLRHRYAFTLVPMLIAIAGYAILLNINGEHHTQYGALFLVTSGCYSAMPVIVCWFTMNLGGHRRRSIGTAWQIGFGNSEYSSFLFLCRV